MRVLFTCVVGSGHFNPMVPLARAAQAAGHDVAFATDPGFCAHVRGLGFEAYPAGLDMPEARRRFIARMPDWSEIPPWEQIRYLYPGLFAGVRVQPMLDDLGTIIPAWRPDLLVHDPAEVTGAVAAEVAGIAHVEHSFGVLRPLELRRLATEAMAGVSARLGVRNPGVGGLGGELYLDICPPGIQLAEVADIERVQPLRPMGFDDAPGSTMPAWVGDLPPRPTVYVTMGTEFNRRPEVFRSILAGLAPEPINVIVTVGASGDPAQLGPQPDNVRVERFVPQSMFLPRCSAFVAHGGSGALMGAVLHGVPMLAIPQGADQFLNAARVVEVGLGLRLLPDELNGAAVRDATLALIDDPRFVGVARSQRAAIDAMPSPEAVVPILEALVRRAA